jgi:hypothetical protein
MPCALLQKGLWDLRLMTIVCAVNLCPGAAVPMAKINSRLLVIRRVFGVQWWGMDSALHGHVAKRCVHDHEIGKNASMLPVMKGWSVKLIISRSSWVNSFL